MMMKRSIFAALLFAATIVACTTTSEGVNTRVSGRFVGSNIDSVYLERMSDNFSSPERIGAATLADNGAFSFEFNVEDGTSPRFYRLTFPSNMRPVTLVVTPGDDIVLESAGDIFLNYRVTGSEESALIQEFNRRYFDAADRLVHAAEKLMVDVNNTADWEMEAYSAARDAIQVQVRFIGSNQDKLAAFYAMRHNVAESYIPQLSGMGINTAHRQSLLSGLKQSYPDSPYIAILEQEVSDDNTMAELRNNVTLASYPDIELEDMFKKSHRLSELEGKVVLLYFWSADSATCNNINAELKPIYEKYHSRGFEVYQVSADQEIAYWIEAVRQQKLPWISLFGGNHPEVFSTYNVVALPAAFMIDREGDIVPVPLVIENLAAEIESRL